MLTNTNQHTNTPTCLAHCPRALSQFPLFRHLECVSSWVDLLQSFGLKAFFHPVAPLQPTDNYNIHFTYTQARPLVTRVASGPPVSLPHLRPSASLRWLGQMVRTSSRRLHLRVLLRLTLLVSATAFMLAPPRLSGIRNDARLFQSSNAGVRRGECFW